MLQNLYGKHVVHIMFSYSPQNNFPWSVASILGGYDSTSHVSVCLESVAAFAGLFMSVLTLCQPAVTRWRGTMCCLTIPHILLLRKKPTKTRLPGAGGMQTHVPNSISTFPLSDCLAFHNQYPFHLLGTTITTYSFH